MNLIKVNVENVNGILVTTSNRVAQELEVNHRDLLGKIDSYVKKFGGAESSAGFYIIGEYTHPQNKQVYRNYLITEKGIAQLIGGYSAAVPKAFDLNVAYINEFERMKKALKKPMSIPEQLLMNAQWMVEAENRLSTVEGNMAGLQKGISRLEQ